MTQQQIVTAGEEAEADDFDDLMTALDVMFHVHECPNHSGAERLAAYAQAKQAFETFCGFDCEPTTEEIEAMPTEDFGEEDCGGATPNAPTSNKVH